MPKATFMYWQKRLDRENPDKELEEKIVEIRKANKDYGYRRMVGELRNQGYLVNKKKVQRIMQKLELQELRSHVRVENTVLIKEKWELLLLIELTDVSIHIYRIKR